MAKEIKLKVNVKINKSDLGKLEKILDRNIEKAHVYLDTQLLTSDKKYIPYLTSEMYKSRLKISRLGKIVYNTPYSKKQWYNRFKHYSNNEDGLRGPEWTLRDFEDNKDEILQEMEKIIGGK